MSKQRAIQLAIYPTPAPETGSSLREEDLYDALEEACRYVYAAKGVLTEAQRLLIREHFQQLFQLMDSRYHLEVWLEERFSYEEYWQSLHQFFPQFAWIQVRLEEKAYGRKVYRFECIPLVLREKEFPFAIHLEDSLAQQFGLSREEAVPQAEKLLLELVEKSLQETKEQAATEKEASIKKETTSSIEETPSKTVKATTTDQKAPKKLAPAAISQEQQALKKLQVINQQLERTIEKLEQSMLYSGIRYFQQEVKEEEDWDKQLTISLREYTYLMQKAKFLEQIWQLNGELVDKTEKMTVNGSQLIYERNQVKKIKDTFTSQDIHYVLYECQLIESRVKVRPRPWFRKPYVKLMKMDYNNLLSKASYFDLLQGESGVLERNLKHSREATTVKDAEEAD
ncbi:ATP synthase subunit B family protein [Enterococcus raffinosus]|uniref:Uncharacterized protein n=2 Tax=Enterococcus TaxID=1350 RepID=R2RP45_9ENTE|nr:hypothetical protein [Enterococcus raffinosus]EOH82346.1 hypothetical protein UAK_00582 [Enterococcus raffinosus ATCC 49464]EOT77816.1 hypothetical protein I590_01353 [Enterococcus raffinosus ATCC 49464]UXK05989.1 hypothetical protein N7K38_19620 [Enterococcus raffinosus]